MLQKPFFKISRSYLSDTFRNTVPINSILTTQTIRLRVNGYRPVFFEDYNLWDILDGVGPSVPDMVSPKYTWLPDTIDHVVGATTEWMRGVGASDEQLKEVTFARKGNRSWFFSLDTGVIMTPPIIYRSGMPESIEGLELDLGERLDVNLGHLSDDGRVSASICCWHWPWLLHWERKSDRLVGWYNSLADLILGRRTIAKFGKFLNNFGFDSKNIEGIMDAVSERQIENDGILSFAITADDIAAVYSVGPTSCMSGDKFVSKFTLLGKAAKVDGQVFNPVRAYAYPLDRTEIVPESKGHLAVAYLGNLEKRKIKARAVVNMVDKTYNRIYGVPYFEQLLQHNGYKRTDCRWSGVRLSLIRCPGGEIAFPYLDGVTPHGIVHDDYVELVNGEGYERMMKPDGNLGIKLGRVARTSAGFIRPESVIFCHFCHSAMATREEEHPVLYPEEQPICAGCARSKFIRAILSLPSEGGAAVYRYARIGDVVFVDPFYVLKDKLDELTVECSGCHKRQVNHRMASREGEPLCRRCHLARELEKSYTPMFYYDSEADTIGVSSFRREDGVPVLGFEHPVHILSLVPLVNPVPCQRCGQMYRKGQECPCN